MFTRQVATSVRRDQRVVVKNLMRDTSMKVIPHYGKHFNKIYEKVQKQDTSKGSLRPARSSG